MKVVINSFLNYRFALAIQLLGSTSCVIAAFKRVWRNLLPASAEATDWF